MTEHKSAASIGTETSIDWGGNSVNTSVHLLGPVSLLTCARPRIDPRCLLVWPVSIECFNDQQMGWKSGYISDRQSSSCWVFFFFLIPVISSC